MSTTLTEQLSWPEPQVKKSENGEVNTDVSAEQKHKTAWQGCGKHSSPNL